MVPWIKAVNLWLHVQKLCSNINRQKQEGRENEGNDGNDGDKSLKTQSWAPGDSPWMSRKVCDFICD